MYGNGECDQQNSRVRRGERSIVRMATAVNERTKTRLGKQHTAEGFTTKASMKNVTVNLNLI